MADIDVAYGLGRLTDIDICFDHIPGQVHAVVFKALVGRRAECLAKSPFEFALVGAHLPGQSGKGGGILELFKQNLPGGTDSRAALICPASLRESTEGPGPVVSSNRAKALTDKKNSSRARVSK